VAEPAPKPLPMIGDNDFPAHPDTAHHDAADIDVADLDAALARAESLETIDLDGLGGIHVHVAWHPLTGTTHVAAELAITTASGSLRFAEPAAGTTDSDTAPPDHPLVERIHAAGPHRWILLGWTSYGEGMQTEHAWLIDDRGGPHLVDSLAWTTDRSHGGVAVEASADQVRIGIPLPAAGSQDGESALHNPGSWLLVHGKQELSLDDLQRLPFSETHVMALRGYYNPPYQDEPSRRHWSGRFVWFASGSRFTLDRHPRNGRPAPPR
jgi:hypothetical protein